MASTPPPPQTTLTVVQYNTLADALCTGNDAGFTSLPPAELAWASRGDALVRALTAADADVVCLQEVDHYHDTFYPARAAAQAESSRDHSASNRLFQPNP
jgi:nocturnin